MTFKQIADEFTWGSDGFCRAISTWIGLNASRSEIERIADKAEARTESAFMNVYENDDSWTDANN